jgi:bifunctional non-homologous end joining protein LigD
LPDVHGTCHAQLYQEGSVRHSVFHGLRNDKPAVEITEETAKPAAEVAAPVAIKKQ